MCHSSGVECKYFVLNPKSKRARDAYAKASRQAIGAYAEAISKENLELSNDLLRWIENETWNEYELRRVEGRYKTETGSPRSIEKKVLVNREKSAYTWLCVIKCGAEFVDETLSFFRRVNPEFEYRIAPE
jgi:hypothetical protein